MAERESASEHHFICECNRADCLETFPLSLDDYSAVRADPVRFILLAGHQNDPDERVVGELQGLVIVEKTGIGEQIARRLSDR